ncbi:deoxyribodipyrimidine photo-lyase [Chitinophaga agrisoli]|uniref:Deoxyribodipyrimidine photo-lyase n=1 Tax=Chitinophaga agrisoli TaxID=2607653 RepID=A0A5B2VT99_9BACT|nr:deoxyribodipyrimidine photo-lyase [Chitinophaga agrisoli]KAA2241828.1 deoxyribodipyrimidine photo-lyase [Chitinophaga agrisoli]
MRINIFWFRRDLRLDDNAGLYHALQQENQVLPIFIFDTNILDQLDEKADRRVTFIFEALEQIQATLEKKGSTLRVYYDTPVNAFKKLLDTYTIDKVFTNHDYEPYARERDQAVKELLQQHSISFHTYKDQVIFDKAEVMKDDGTPYTVFTPYSRKWQATLNDFYLKSYPTHKYIRNFLKEAPHRIPSLATMGFKEANGHFPPGAVKEELIRQYEQQRDIPGITGTSHMGVHLRFGTVSIRKLAQKAQEWSTVYLNELVWREFYQMILWHFPEVGKGKSFKPAYDHVRWRYNEADFERWCKGQTGYPIVDAGMRELNATGFMHNRVRMITASFLAKHLLIDWRWGEAYFAEKLLDYDLAANNGNWQWAAGCGCDAVPYFRIFNPTLQTKKFDPQLIYIKKWVPELETLDYPAPIIQHEIARKRCLEAYKRALQQQG